MKQFLPTIIILILVNGISYSVCAQQHRTIDGWGNNTAHPEWGAVGTHVLTQTIGYADGISTPAGPDRPNPRVISNILFTQNSLANDVMGLSAFTWVWGQFIDHDITFSPNHPTETFDISIPTSDPFFDPHGTGTARIPMARSDYDLSTGTSAENPRKYPNLITAYIDGSAIYGSDYTRAHWLRTFENGKLKTSSGNLLPFNTSNGEYENPIDPDIPWMDMPLHHVQKWFVAGDVRANENPFLTAMHTIFVREHNRLCDSLFQVHPSWSDERLYQHSRKLIGGMIQAIVYEEWLPTMGIQVEAYQGYDESTNPGIMNVFNTAAYRYGHTTINSLLVRLDNNGKDMPQGDILLRDAFFNPNAVLEVHGIEPYLVGMSTVVEQDFDCKVVDELRNFLFGKPGSGGMDLVSINLNRGRDRGLPDYNTIRADFGMNPVNSFPEITQDPLMSNTLAELYKDVNNVDPWAGMLAEDHVLNSLFGPTARTIIQQQFESLRDGDRFYYENDPGLTHDEKTWIRNTRLSHIIRRNTSIDIIRDQIFVAGSLLTPTASDNLYRPFSMQIYPNPVELRMAVRIECSNRQDARLQIRDVNGKTVWQKNLDLYQGNNILSLTLPQGLAGGVYVAVLDGNGKSVSTKFFKQ